MSVALVSTAPRSLSHSASRTWRAGVSGVRASRQRAVRARSSLHRGASISPHTTSSAPPLSGMLGEERGEPGGVVGERDHGGVLAVVSGSASTAAATPAARASRPSASRPVAAANGSHAGSSRSPGVTHTVVL